MRDEPAPWLGCAVFIGLLAVGIILFMMWDGHPL